MFTPRTFSFPLSSSFLSPPTDSPPLHSYPIIIIILDVDSASEQKHDIWLFELGLTHST
jgi:hypothetical protein